MRDAGTMRLPPFCEPKQENAPQHPPHLFRCQDKAKEYSYSGKKISTTDRSQKRQFFRILFEILRF